MLLSLALITSAVVARACARLEKENDAWFRHRDTLTKRTLSMIERADGRAAGCAFAGISITLDRAPRIGHKNQSVGDSFAATAAAAAHRALASAGPRYLEPGASSINASLVGIRRIISHESTSRNKKSFFESHPPSFSSKSRRRRSPARALLFLHQPLHFSSGGTLCRCVPRVRSCVRCARAAHARTDASGCIESSR